MNRPHYLPRLAALAVLGLAVVPCGWAATVDLVSASYTISTGSTVEINTLSLSGPGTVTATLTDNPWPAPMPGILFELIDGSGHVLGSASGFGTSAFDVAAAGTYYAVSAGTVDPLPGTSVGFGSFGLDLTFSTAVPAVPLPPAIALLGSGLALIAVRRRRPAAAINM